MVENVGWSSFAWDLAQVMMGALLVPVTHYCWRAAVVAPQLRLVFPINAEKEAQLVIPTIAHSEFSRSEYIRLATPLESVMAVKYLDVIMRPYRATLKFLDVVFSETISEEKLQRAIITVGGPVHNKVSATILEGWKKVIEFDGHQLVSHRSGKRFEAEISELQIVRDIGLLIVTPSPWGEKKSATVLAGCRGFGSIGVLHMLSVPKWRSKILKVARQSKAQHGYAVVVSLGVDHFSSGAIGFRDFRVEEEIVL